MGDEFPNPEIVLEEEKLRRALVDGDIETATNKIKHMMRINKLIMDKYPDSDRVYKTDEDLIKSVREFVVSHSDIDSDIDKTFDNMIKHIKNGLSK